MSYNILAQALIKRELFPHSGNILKWVCTAMVALIQGRYAEIPLENSQGYASEGVDRVQT